MRPSWNGDGPAVSNDPRSMNASIIMKAELSGARFEGDVRVLPRHTLVDIAGSFRKHYVIRSDEFVSTIAHLYASAQIDSPAGERVRPLFGDAAQHHDIDARRLRIAVRSLDIGCRHSGELQMKFLVSPALLRAGHVVDVDHHVSRVAPRRLQPFQNPLAETRVAGKHGFEPRARFARG